jgi:phosphoribosylaminoimidazolecarboxamide formyltransferase/IMP cyclohydrolase
VIKHGNPAGVALGRGVAGAYRRARDGDQLSAFGGVVVVNRRATSDFATLLAETFLEVAAAPEWDEEALAVLRKKKSLRLLSLEGIQGLSMDRSGSRVAARAGFGPDGLMAPEIRSAGQGFLIQTPMPAVGDPMSWPCVTEREATEDDRSELLFAWQVVRHVRSNAIVLTRERQTIGVGCGQTSRIDALEVALLKAERAGHRVEGCVLASDAFFPFRDVADRAAQAGIQAIVQPGGSIRDAESIAACNEAGLAMLFTDERVFMH